MKNKIVLVLVDGMRPDSIMQCGNSFLADLRAESTHCFHAATVFPSVTLPCHTSLFLGVDPDRHGITDNLWMPQVRPVDGIFEAAHKADLKCAMFYNWQQLRDLCRPGTLDHAYFQRMAHDMEAAWEQEREMANLTIDYIKKEAPDFTFLYIGSVDEIGHHYGWMGKEYLDTVAHASDCIKRVKEALPEGYQLIVTADHGGHDRTHGTRLPEDMTIPMLFWGSAFEKGKALAEANIKDIAPTVAELLGVKPSEEWDGKSVLKA